MHTLDSQLTTSSSMWSRLRRDLRLLVRIAKMTTQYVLAGRRVRREYRRSQLRGDIYWLDDDPTLQG
jgi:hypothetical protein